MKTFTKISASLIVLLLISCFSYGQNNEKENKIKMGGLLRYNFGVKKFESQTKAPARYATFDTWGVNAKGTLHGIDLDFEYRFHPTNAMHFIHHGYFGYKFNDKYALKLGVFKTPFGIADNPSHSFWYQGSYYVGLEDDYDMGLGFDYDINDKLKLELAYFRQAEPEGPSFGGKTTFGNAGPGRYSYDITTGRTYTLDGATYYESIRELNTGNFRLTYDLIDGLELGTSAQVGQIYNDKIDKFDLSTAYAGHVYMNKYNFSVKLEYAYYDYQASGLKIDSLGVETIYKLDNVQMGAFGSNHLVASKANLYLASVAYTIPIDKGPLKSVQPFCDFTYMDKANPEFGDVMQIMPGMVVNIGPIVSYIEFDFGKNQSWLTDNSGIGFDKGQVYTNDPAQKGKYNYTEDMNMVGKAVPVSAIPWNMKFNINVGYYF